MTDLGSLLQRPKENVVRGSLFAAIAIPAGIIVWDVLWTLGVIASLVAFGMAWAAATLYRRGSGGVVSVLGASIIAGVVVVGLLLSFYVGLLTDYVLAVSGATGLGPLETIALADFWPYFAEDFGAMIENNLVGFGLATLFSVIGAYSVLHNAFRTATPTAPADPYAVAAAAPAAAASEPELAGKADAIGVPDDAAALYADAENDRFPMTGASPIVAEPAASIPGPPAPDSARDGTPQAK